jgi:predicted GNAT family N-acyltransferase
MFTQVHHRTKEYDQTVALRNEVLRIPLGLELSQEEGPEEKDSFHLASWRDNALVACLVLKPLSDTQLQMRQLAVREDCRRKGVGHALVNYAESFAMDHDYEEIVLHARETVLGFYEKMGYEIEGDRFIEVTLPHLCMRKSLLKGQRLGNQGGINKGL